jgi:hypothetical protein
MSAKSQDIKINPNKLVLQKSPYLLQHAYNPVNWHPWGEEAFEKADLSFDRLFHMPLVPCYGEGIL